MRLGRLCTGVRLRSAPLGLGARDLGGLDLLHRAALDACERARQRVKPRRMHVQALREQRQHRLQGLHRRRDSLDVLLQHWAAWKHVLHQVLQ